MTAEFATDDYRKFLEGKIKLAERTGFDVEPGEINPLLKPHQAAMVQWAVAGGRRAIFASFGLGKTIVQIETLRLILKRTGGRALIVLPLGVRQEFIRDAAMLGVPVKFIRRIEEAEVAGIHLTNYETVRDGKLDPNEFMVASLDEAACLRGFGGTKTFREFMRLFDRVRYRFVATATPSPNEYIELLAYAAFLDIIDVGQGKTRFFQRNSEKNDDLTLYPHKVKEFWLWVASWALFIQKPSDICGCPCHGEKNFTDNASDALSSRHGSRAQSETAHGAAAATAAAKSSPAQIISSPVRSSAVGASGPSTVEKGHAPTPLGKTCSTDVPDAGVRIGQITADAGSPCANDGSHSPTSSPTWGSHHRAGPSNAGTTTATTSLQTATGTAEKPKLETPDDQSSSPTAAEANLSQLGRKSLAPTIGSSIPATSSAGRPSGCSPTCCDACRCDEGYDLPDMVVRWHEVPSDHRAAGAERDGQARLFRNAAIGVTDAAKEKRDSLPSRMAKLGEIIAADPDSHRLIWHDLEDERRAIEKAVPNAVSVYGAQDLEEREQAIIDFSDGKITHMAAKPVMAGSGCNFQRYCHKAVYLGISFKFNDFFQSLHRIQRFLQPHPVEIDIIYSEAEREIKRTLQDKWARHEEQAAIMSGIIREFGLANAAKAAALNRTIGVERAEVSGEMFRVVHNDCVVETRSMSADSVDLIVTSIPFEGQYEYTPSFNDFGHSESSAEFWRQMDFLIPEMLRVLKPGRVCAIHVKDRITPGGITGLGFQTVTPISDFCTVNFTKHGFAFLARKTIVTDVVRENNQTYRLGWTEQCKDGSRMGYGLPEYMMVFRKPPTDRSNGYADDPVMKAKKWWLDDGSAIELSPFDKADKVKAAGDRKSEPPAGAAYSRARWQIDAHGFARSDGNRLLTSDELLGLAADVVWKKWKASSLANPYDYEHHVTTAEALDAAAQLPKTFMLLPPHSWHPDVWTDVTRMRTLNGAQSAGGRELHICPIPFDIVDRCIAQFSMPGETVLDPFAGLATVPFCAIKLKRKGIGIELNADYFRDGVRYCQSAEAEASVPTLFDILDATQEAAE